MNLINRFWDGLNPAIQGCIIGLAAIHLLPLLIIWVNLYFELIQGLM